MSNPTDEWPAPEDQIGPQLYVHALGQVALAYNGLENLMELIFMYSVPLERTYAQRLFHNLHNRDRVDLLAQFIKSEKDDALREALQHVVLSYDICTDNRNVLMHVTFGGIDPNLPRLSKRARNDPTTKIEFHESLESIRQTADEIIALFKYGSFVLFILMNTASGIAGRSLVSLPQRPPKPRKLTPYQPPADRKDAQSPPQSSGA